MSVKQVSVFIENKRGRLIAVTGCLAARNINIRAISASDTADYGILRLIVDDPELAAQTLKDAEFTVRVTEVLAVAAEDKPGGLNHVLEILRDSGFNVDYIYAFFGERAAALNIIKVDQPEAAEQALTKAGVRLLTPQEIYGV